MPVKPTSESKTRSQESDAAKREAVGGTGMKKGGMPMAMKKGGMPMAMKNGKKVPAFAVKKMASGGLASGHKSADGIASKGKTKAKQITMSGSKGMKKGGYC